MQQFFSSFNWLINEKELRVMIIQLLVGRKYEEKWNIGRDTIGQWVYEEKFFSTDVYNYMMKSLT